MQNDRIEPQVKPIVARYFPSVATIAVYKCEGRGYTVGTPNGPVWYPTYGEAYSRWVLLTNALDKNETIDRSYIGGDI
jgi:hypothetical protein